MITNFALGNRDGIKQRFYTKDNQENNSTFFR